jgi:hypothetical protein
VNISVPRRAIVRRGPGFAARFRLEFAAVAEEPAEARGSDSINMLYPGLGLDSHSGVRARVAGMATIYIPSKLKGA